jgi:hypothetical protein
MLGSDADEVSVGVPGGGLLTGGGGRNQVSCTSVLDTRHDAHPADMVSDAAQAKHVGVRRRGR